MLGKEEGGTVSQIVIHCNPGILSGTPVFIGTRVPAQAMLDYLEGGHTVDEFLDDFLSVTRAQVLSALELAKELLLARAAAA